MGQSARRLWELGLVVGCGLVGCDYDAGHDYAVAVPWLINGLAPSAELCETYGVAGIKLTVTTPSSEESVIKPCDEAFTLSDGNDYGGFVTNEAFDYDVIYGVTVEMVDEDGKRVVLVDPDSGEQTDVYYRDTFQVFYGDALPWVLRPLELFSPRGDVATLTGSWDVGDGDLEQGCADERIDTVVLWVTSRTDADFLDAVEIGNAACTDGAFVSETPLLAEGAYLFKYVAIDERGGIVERGDAIEAIVDRKGDLDLPRERFGRR